MLHVWSQSIGKLQIAPLIFLCCPLGITTIFSNTIHCAIIICSSFVRLSSSVGTSSTHKLFTVDWHGTFPWIAFKWHVLNVSNDICTWKRWWEGYLFEITHTTYIIWTFLNFLFKCINAWIHAFTFITTVFLFLFLK